MLKRFIRWILPLMVLVLIATYFVMSPMVAIHAAEYHGSPNSYSSAELLITRVFLASIDVRNSLNLEVGVVTVYKLLLLELGVRLKSLWSPATLSLPCAFRCPIFSRTVTLASPNLRASSILPWAAVSAR